MEGGAAAEGPRRGAAKLAPFVCRAIFDPHPFVPERKQDRKHTALCEYTDTYYVTTRAVLKSASDHVDLCPQHERLLVSLPNKREIEFGCKRV